MRLAARLVLVLGCCCQLVAQCVELECTVNLLLGALPIHSGQVDERGLRNVHTGAYTFCFRVEEVPYEQGFLARTFKAY